MHKLENSLQNAESGHFIDEVASLAAAAEKKRPEHRTEQEKVAIMGKPRLGDIVRAQIRIKESKEFRVSRFALLTTYLICLLLLF